LVDEERLERLIKESGKTKTFLANKVGCTVQAFRLKCTNKTEFKLSEVDILCREINITKLTDKESVFFAKKVDKMTT
jgi:hypothetical protein